MALIGLVAAFTLLALLLATAALFEESSKTEPESDGADVEDEDGGFVCCGIFMAVVVLFVVAWVIIQASQR